MESNYLRFPIPPNCELKKYYLKELKNNDWKNILDQNLADMYEGNSWGVPSFKVTNLDNSNPYYQWGQDRIWLIENEIINRLINHR